MIRLVLASAIWAFSFGLIKRYLTGLHPQFVAEARLLLSCLVFLPFARFPRDSRGQFKTSFLLQLLGVGALEFGLMYICYLTSFQTLESWQVALFTSLTPIAVTLIASLYRRDWSATRIAPVALATLAAALLTLKTFSSTPALQGILLVQAANLFFAWGQVHHVRTLQTLDPRTQKTSVFFWEYLGGVLAVSVFIAFHPHVIPSDWGFLASATGLALFYSGVVASGLGFFLWNTGAGRVPPATLSVLNNLKAPLAALVSVIVFKENADPRQLLGSICLFGIGWLLAFRMERGEALLRPRASG